MDESLQNEPWVRWMLGMVVVPMIWMAVSRAIRRNGGRQPAVRGRWRRRPRRKNAGLASPPGKHK